MGNLIKTLGCVMAPGALGNVLPSPARPVCLCAIIYPASALAVICSSTFLIISLAISLSWT